jgi:hypothetical protein
MLHRGPPAQFEIRPEVVIEVENMVVESRSDHYSRFEEHEHAQCYHQPLHFFVAENC